jgi:heme exporter protein C
MFIHVSAAWMSMFVYPTVAGTSTVALIWRHPLADVAAAEAAPLGAAFTLICLVTGSLRGKPMWVTYWVWDARLTCFLGVAAQKAGQPEQVRQAWSKMRDQSPEGSPERAAIKQRIGQLPVPERPHGQTLLL